MLRTVHLHGRLGKRFGREFRLDVQSPAEAVAALMVQRPGFLQYIRSRNYVVTAGRSRDREQCPALTEQALRLQLGGASDIHIVPAPLMAGIETILIIGLTVALVGLAAVSILLMPKAPRAGDREEATKRESGLFDGAQNVIEQGHAMPLVYGDIRTGSVVISSGISTADFATTDNPPGGKSGFLDEDNESGSGVVGNTGSVTTVETVGGGTAGGGGTWLNDHGNIQLAGGGGKGGGGGDGFQEAPNTLRSNATARLLEAISEGEIVGLVDGLKSVYLDETPIQNADGSFNFQGAVVDQRVGLPDQDYMPGFPTAENTINVATDVKVLTGPVVQTINDADVTVARVTIRVPALYKQDTEDGDIDPTSVSLKISVQADGGGYADVYTMVINGKTNQPYDRSVDVYLPAGLVRNVKVTRLTADSDVSSLVNSTRWQLLTEIIEAKLAYPDTALVGLVVDARQFGSTIPVRSYHVKGLIIEVPTNYDPVARTYDGIWDGTFKRAWSNSPPWITRDLIVNRRYGLGARIGANVPDKWALYAIAQYCDQLVPDGFGGMVPRYTLNTVVRTKTQAYDLIAAFCSNFRGWAYWGSGTISFAQDAPEDPSLLVTRSNIVDGLISYGRVTPHERRRSASVVYWNDPSDGYRLVPEIYENPDLIRRFGRRTGQEVTAFGVTNKSQAHRLARFLLEDESEASNTVATYSVGDDHSFVAPGHVAMVADPMFTQNRRGGRVKGSGADSIQIDEPYPFVAGPVYTLRTMLPDGTVSVRAITNGAGTTDQVALGGASWAVGNRPNPGAVFTIETNAVANRQFRIRQIETDRPPYRVKAVLHDPTKYPRVEQDIDLETPNYIEGPVGPLQPPTALGVFEYLAADGTASVPNALFSWTPAADARVIAFQAQAKGPVGDWFDLGNSLEPSRTIRNVQPGEWLFRVRALDGGGRQTAWQEGSADLDGQTDALPEVTGLTIANDNVTHETKLTWGAPVSTRPLRYQVLFDDAGVYGDAAVLAEIDAQQYPVALPGTYWVRTTFLGFTSPAAPSAVVSDATGRITDVRGFEPNRSYGLRSLAESPVFSDTYVVGPPDTVTINVGASSLVNDLGDTLNLPAGTIPGGAPSTKYFLYRTMADPTDPAGSYGSSINLTDALAPGKIYLGFWTTRATAGGVGGGGNYGGDDCVDGRAWVLTDKGPVRARDVRPGHMVQIADQLTGERGGLAEVTESSNESSERVRLTTESGARLTLSLNTPMLMRDGSLAIAAHMLGFEVPVEDERGYRYELVVDCEFAGLGPVAKIRCGGQVYAAGDEPGRYVYSHNPLFEQKP